MNNREFREELKKLREDLGRIEAEISESLRQSEATGHDIDRLRESVDERRAGLRDAVKSDWEQG